MTQCYTCSLLFPSSHMHTLTLTPSYSPYKCTIILSCPHTYTPSHAHPHTCTFSHMPTLTHAHPHTCTPSQTPRMLYAVVLFDPLAADFNIDSMWLVMYNGQKRLLSGQRALQAVGTQINQKISPPDRIHINVYVHVFLGCSSLLLLLPFSSISSSPSPSPSPLHLTCLLIAFSFSSPSSPPFPIGPILSFKPLLSPPPLSLHPPSPLTHIRFQSPLVQAFWVSWCCLTLVPSTSCEH